MPYTKKEVIVYLREFYMKVNRPIVHIDFNPKKDHPFGIGTIKKLFSTLENALIESNIPSYKQTHLQQEVICSQCNTKFFKRIGQIKTTNNNFCSKSCSALYNNKNKTYGFRVSKLELYLQTNLKGYNFTYSDRKICDGLELDIYIDELKIAFEINGIFHYKPIFGVEKLTIITDRDERKQKKCIEKNIILYVIKDTSSKFTKAYGEEILFLIYKLIHKSLFWKVIHDKVNIQLI